MSVRVRGARTNVSACRVGPVASRRNGEKNDATQQGGSEKTFTFAFFLWNAPAEPLNCAGKDQGHSGRVSPLHGTSTFLAYTCAAWKSVPRPHRSTALAHIGTINCPGG